MLFLIVDCGPTRGLRGSSTVVPVPVVQPAQQLVSTALLSLLTNNGLQRARPVLVHPQQRLFPPRLPRGRRLRGRGRPVVGGGGGGEAQLPAGGLSRASSGRRPTLFSPGGVALAQAGLGGAGVVGRCGITFGGRNLLGCRGASGGFAGSSGL